MSNNQANQVKAAQLFRDAANGGDSEAQFQYGICLRDGNGIPQNLQEATEWFRKAAGLGHSDAAQVLSVLQRPNSSASQMPNTGPSSANPPTAETTAHDKGVGLAFIVGIVAFIILCCVCRDTVGGGLFSEPESYINWPGVFIGTGVCAFIAYKIGKSSKK
jgi:hypothetical protein